MTKNEFIEAEFEQHPERWVLQILKNNGDWVDSHIQRPGRELSLTIPYRLRPKVQKMPILREMCCYGPDQRGGAFIQGPVRTNHLFKGWHLPGVFLRGAEDWLYANNWTGNENAFYFIDLSDPNAEEIIRMNAEKEEDLPDPELPLFTGCYDKSGEPLYVGDRVRYELHGEHTKREYWDPEYEIVFNPPSFTFKHVGGSEKDPGSHAFVLKHCQRDLFLLERGPRPDRTIAKINRESGGAYLTGVSAKDVDELIKILKMALVGRGWTQSGITSFDSYDFELYHYDFDSWDKAESFEDVAIHIIKHGPHAVRVERKIR